MAAMMSQTLALFGLLCCGSAAASAVTGLRGSAQLDSKIQTLEAEIEALQPEVVARTLVEVEGKWVSQALALTACDPAGNVSSAALLEEEMGQQRDHCKAALQEDFEASCTKIVSAVVHGSAGKKDDVEEYMQEVCSVKDLRDTQQRLCAAFGAAVTDGMSSDPEANREGLDTRKICSAFFDHGYLRTFADEEAKRQREEEEALAAAREKEERERREREEEEKRKAELERREAEVQRAAAEATDARSEAEKKQREQEKKAKEAAAKAAELKAAEEEAKKAIQHAKEASERAGAVGMKKNAAAAPPAAPRPAGEGATVPVKEKKAMVEKSAPAMPPKKGTETKEEKPAKKRDTPPARSPSAPSAPAKKKEATAAALQRRTSVTAVALPVEPAERLSIRRKTTTGPRGPAAPSQRKPSQK